MCECIKVFEKGMENMYLQQYLEIWQKRFTTFSKKVWKHKFTFLQLSK